LYLALDKVLSQDFFDKVHVLFMSDVQRKECGFDEIDFNEFVKSLEEPLTAFYKVAGLDTDDALKLFRYAMNYLHDESLNAQKKGGTSLQEKLTKLVYKGLQANAYAPEILVSYALVSPFSTEECKKYDFERKIAQAAGNSKINFPDFRRILHNIIALSFVRAMSFGATLARKSTYEVACVIADSVDSFSLCGANEYDGVKWFNKERIEESLWYMLSSNIMCKPNLSRTNIYKLYTVLDAAKEGAEYHIEKFLEAVAPAVKKQSKQPKAVSQKKATDKKTSSKQSKTDTSEKAPKATKTRATKKAKAEKTEK